MAKRLTGACVVAAGLAFGFVVWAQAAIKCWFGTWPFCG